MSTYKKHAKKSTFIERAYSQEKREKIHKQAKQNYFEKKKRKINSRDLLAFVIRLNTTLEVN